MTTLAEIIGKAMGEVIIELVDEARTPFANSARWLWLYAGERQDVLKKLSPVGICNHCRFSVGAYNAERTKVADAAWWLYQHRATIGGKTPQQWLMRIPAQNIVYLHTIELRAAEFTRDSSVADAAEFLWSWGLISQINLIACYAEDIKHFSAQELAALSKYRTIIADKAEYIWRTSPAVELVGRMIAASVDEVAASYAILDAQRTQYADDVWTLVQHGWPEHAFEFGSLTNQRIRDFAMRALKWSVRPQPSKATALRMTNLAADSIVRDDHVAARMQLKAALNHL